MKLYFLPDSTNYRTIANLFGLGKSTVCTIIHFNWKATAEKLINFVYLLSNGKVFNIIKVFKDMSSFQKAVAFLHVCLIRIKAPANNTEDYVNRTEYHTIFLQGLVDNKNLFQNIFVEWPGKTHDARLFRNFS